MEQIMMGFAALVYYLFGIGLLIFVLRLLWRFVKAHEKLADAMFMMLVSRRIQTPHKLAAKVGRYERTRVEYGPNPGYSYPFIARITRLEIMELRILRWE